MYLPVDILPFMSVFENSPISVIISPSPKTSVVLE